MKQNDHNSFSSCSRLVKNTEIVQDNYELHVRHIRVRYVNLPTVTNTSSCNQQAVFSQGACVEEGE